MPAMQVERWATIVENAGFDIVYCGYFGRLRFWTEKQPRNLRQRTVLRFLRIVQPLLRHLLPANRKAYSPFPAL